MTAITPGTIMRKKRPLTYGKKSSPATFANDLSFFDGESSPDSSTKRSTPRPKAAIKPVITPAVRLVPSTTPQTKQPSAARSTSNLTLPSKDAFDVPSSDEESTVDQVERKLFVKAPAKRALVDDREGNQSVNGSKKPRLDASARKSVTFAGADTQSKDDIQLAMHQKRSTVSPKPQLHKTPVLDEAAMRGMSAIEKLKYRKAQLSRSASPASHQSSPNRPSVNNMRSNARQRRPLSTDTASQQTPPVSALSRESSMVDADDAQQPTEAVATPLKTTPTHRRTSLTLSPRSSPARALQSPGEMTPRQKRIWTDLFDDMDVEGAIKRTEQRTTGQPPQSASRTRLIDRLRARSQPEDSMDISDDDTSTTSVSQQSETVPEVTGTPRRAATATVARARLTYTAEHRSMLQDDSLEDTLLNGVGSARQGRLPSNAYGMDDEEELDSGVAKIRSVHELRAQGRASRTTAEIEDALQEISNKASTLLRRITTLCKLATKLGEGEFAKTFLHNGHEIRLLEASDTSGDDAVRTVFVTAAIHLMRVDLSQQSLESIRRMLSSSSHLFSQHCSVLAAAKSNKALIRVQPTLCTLLESTISGIAALQDCTAGSISCRTLYVHAWDILLGKLQQDAGTPPLSDNMLSTLCPAGYFEQHGQEHDTRTAISILESLSTSSSTSDWSPTLVGTIAALPNVIELSSAYDHHSKFLAYRLCLNITNNKLLDHFMFATAGSIPSLLRSISGGFKAIARSFQDDEERRLQLDYLILALGIMINLSEYSQAARRTLGEQDSRALLLGLVSIFKHGYDQATLAESEDQSSNNVAAGYLAVMLASFCQDAELRNTIEMQLDGQKLDTLVQAVEEFIKHHQRVDNAHFEGSEGQEIWTAFTNRLKSVLTRLEKGS